MYTNFSLCHQRKTANRDQYSLTPDVIMSVTVRIQTAGTELCGISPDSNSSANPLSKNDTLKKKNFQEIKDNFGVHRIWSQKPQSEQILQNIPFNTLNCSAKTHHHTLVCLVLMMIRDITKEKMMHSGPGCGQLVWCVLQVRHRWSVETESKELALDLHSLHFLCAPTIVYGS